MQFQITQGASCRVLLPMFLCAAGFLGQGVARAQAGNRPAASVPLTLAQAIDLALKQNRSLQLAHLAVTDSEHKKETARSANFPRIKNESSFLHITELSGVEIQPALLAFPRPQGQSRQRVSLSARDRRPHTPVAPAWRSH